MVSRFTSGKRFLSFQVNVAPPGCVAGEWLQPSAKHPSAVHDVLKQCVVALKLQVGESLFLLLIDLSQESTAVPGKPLINQCWVGEGA